MRNETSYPKQRVIKELCANERAQNFLHGFRNFFSRFVFRRKFAGYTRFDEQRAPADPPFCTRNTRVYTPSGQVHPPSQHLLREKIVVAWTRMGTER